MTGSDALLREALERARMDLRAAVTDLPQPTLGLAGGVNRGAVIDAIDRVFADGAASRPAVRDGLREALERIDALPVGHYRRNGFASPDPWIRQRDVRRIIRAALADKGSPSLPPSSDSGLRAIVKRVANMGSCSQTHHEHIANDARRALSESQP